MDSGTIEYTGWFRAVRTRSGGREIAGIPMEFQCAKTNAAIFVPEGFS
jgi:hypothetical protein